MSPPPDQRQRIINGPPVKDQSFCPPPEDARAIGQGRSAVVYRSNSTEGSPLATKIFVGESLSKLALLFLTGAGNPYTWCQEAIEAAVARRKILSHLVPCWFPNRLRLPETTGWAYMARHRAFALQCEFVKGVQAPLQSPFLNEPVDRLKDLTDNIMQPLQNYLVESGFDGLVWQAGYGNPVACNNFLLEESGRWVWIDLESGVPALFALDLRTTLRFYLPKSFQYCNWLFDDVNIPQLRRYLQEQQNHRLKAIPPAAWSELMRQVDLLDEKQTAWKQPGRHLRSLQYALNRKRISPEQVNYYQTHPLRWQGILWASGFVALEKKLHQVAQTGLFRIRTLNWKELLKKNWRYFSSATYRWRVARYYFACHLRQWKQRGFVSREMARKLHRSIKEETDSAYLTDFSVHLALKPLCKFVQWGILPILWGHEVVNNATFAFLLLAGGSIARTAYTAGRFLQALLRRQSLPWIALVAGLFPVVGNAAYPFQLLYQSAQGNRSVASFIIYDLAAALGRKIPIWGGADGLLEHYCARKAGALIGLPGRLFSGKGDKKNQQTEVNSCKSHHPNENGEAVFASGRRNDN